MALRIQLFGSFQLWRGQELVQWTKGEKHKALLKILLTEPGKVFSHDELIEHLWPEDDPEKAKANLFNRVAELRRVLEPNLKHGANSKYILTRHLGFSFNYEDCWIDTYEFQQHYRKFRQLENGGNGSQAIQEAEAALNLYQGDFLEEDRYESWAQVERERLKNQYLEVGAFLAEQYARRGEYQKAIGLCRAMLEHDQLRESFYRQLMLYQYICGDQSEALRMFERCKAVLKENLEIEPSSETKQLYEQIKARNVPNIDHCYPQPTITRSEIPYTLSPGSVPFVGRRAELAQLLSYAEKASQGHGCCVLLSGEAGVGKTRLIQEFSSHVRSQFSCHVFDGRCGAIGKLPYHPLAEIAHEMMNRYSPEKLKTFEPSLLSEVAKLVPEIRVSIPNLPSNPPLSPQQEHLRFFEGIAKFLTSFADTENRKPTILFLDDLHWADEASIDFLSFFLQRIKTQPLLIIGAYRVEGINEGHFLHKLVQSEDLKDIVSVIALPRLGLAEVGEFVSKLPLKANQSEVFHGHLYHETEGNPLFLVLTLQHLFEKGILRVDGDAWQLNIERLGSDRAGLPLLLKDLIRQRLSLLGEAEMKLLRLTSAVGRAFDAPLLEQAWDGPRDQCLATLAKLVNAQLLFEDHGHYEFSHDKIREVVYNEMSPQQQQLMHQRVLHALEQLRVDRLEPIAGLLARHAYKAGQWKKALEYSLQALKTAVKEYRLVDGLELAEMGLKCIQKLEVCGENLSYTVQRRFELLSQQFEILDFLGRRTEQERDLDEMQKLAEQLSDAHKQALIFRKRGDLYKKLGKYPEAQEATSKALELYKQLGAREGQGGCLNDLGNIYESSGKYEEALHCYKQQLEIGQEINDKLMQANSLSNTGIVYRVLGRHEEALKTYQRAIEIFRELGNLRSEAAVLNNMGIIYWLLVNHDKALESYQLALGISQAIGDRANEASAVTNIGILYHVMGRYEEALHQGQLAIEICRQLGDKRGQAQNLLNLAAAYLYLGKYEEALQASQECFRLAQKIGDKQSEGASLSNMGIVYRILGRYEEARECVQQGLKVFREIGYKLAEGLGLQSMANLFFELKRYTEALETCAEAKAIFEKLGAKSQQIATLSKESIVHLELKAMDQALASSSQAVRMLEEGQSSSGPHEVYFNHYQVLWAHNSPQEALTYLEKAYREVLQQADKIQNAELRKSFLNVKANREIVETWEKHTRRKNH